MIDVSEAFIDLLQTVQLKRKTAGGRDENGNWVDGTLSTTDIQAVVQSLTADERMTLPEAVRTKETIKLHSITKLQTANDDLYLDADVIVYDGLEWEINQVFNRSIIGGYYKAIGVRL